jgi:two-component system, chemotaxis family, sensor kinase CheA
MEQVETSVWVDSLGEVSTGIKEMAVTDREAIVANGAKLEELMGSIPPILMSTSFFVGRCLFSLQILYGQQGDNLADLKVALCLVLDDIQILEESGSEGGEKLNKDSDALELLLEQVEHGGSGETPAEEASATAGDEVAESDTQEGETVAAVADPESRTFSLDDIASMMVSLEAGDADGQERVKRALLSLDPSIPLEISEKTEVAASKLNLFLTEGGDEQCVIQEISSILEEAMWDLEDGQGAQVTEEGSTGVCTEPQAVEAESVDESVPDTVDQEVTVPVESVNGEVVAPAPEEMVAEPEVEESAQAAVSPPEESASQAAEAVPEKFTLGEETDEEFIGEYLTESREYIEDSEAALLALENDPGDMESVNEVFRAFHTIKGTSGFLDLKYIANFAHKAETLLSRVREGEIQFNTRYATLSLGSVDMLKELLNAVEAALAGENPDMPAQYGPLLHALNNPDDPEALAQLGVSATEKPESGTEPVASGEVVAAVATGGGGAAAAQAKAPASEPTIRIRTDKLDSLIDQVGEMVIAHSMVAQHEASSTVEDHELAKKVSHAGKIVRELQDSTMAMRMVPFKGTFQKMTRLVRDLANKSGKQVDFIREGEDTEIDRNMVDLISDPLVHMIRNAVDHGVESPEIRQAAGKPAKGEVMLRAYHAGGNVIVELRDNGAGLDRDKLTAKAVSRDIIDEETAKSMTDSEAYNLIFEAGFSTAEKVTDVSGRGVGMDVVRRNIEALHGRVDINSAKGEGTTFVIRLPLTMAITDGMMVKVGAQRFIIPILNIQISTRPEASDISTVVGKGEMMGLRGKQIPLFRLHEIFKIDNAIKELSEGLVIVLETGEKTFAILVDELVSKLQVVAKTLGEGIGRIRGISGGAILGDGEVGLIVDPTGLYEVAQSGATIDQSSDELFGNNG